jgi:hypothetical protein
MGWEITFGFTDYDRVVTVKLQFNSGRPDPVSKFFS